jgi:predicted nucleotidyltransferase
MLDRAAVETRVRSFFDRRPAGVVAVYLFGSVARGDARPASDVDLAVLLAEPPPRTLDGLGLDLADELQAELGAPVQVVVLDTAPCDLTHRVLRDGRLLVDRDPSARIRFEVRARNEYFDLKPFLDRYRRVSPETAPPR